VPRPGSNVAAPGHRNACLLITNRSSITSLSEHPPLLKRPGGARNRGGASGSTVWTRTIARAGRNPAKAFAIVRSVIAFHERSGPAPIEQLLTCPESVGPGIGTYQAREGGRPREQNPSALENLERQRTQRTSSVAQRARCPNQRRLGLRRVVLDCTWREWCLCASTCEYWVGRPVRVFALTSTVVIQCVRRAQSE
jgi:hypothetical protein